MTHPRQIIKEAIAQRLREAQTNAGQHIFVGRAKPLFDSDLPAILIYGNDENIVTERWDTDGFGELERNLTVFIEAVELGKDNLDNKLDSLSMQIEQALDGWNIPGHQSAIIRFKATDSDIMIEGRSIYGAIRLSYNITYRTKTHNNLLKEI